MTTAIAAPARAAVAFDLEGGLINVRRIRKLATDASRFHSAMLGCPSNRNVVAAARRAHESGKAVLVMTGGDRRLEQLVITWLNRNGVPATLLLMRSRHDYRPSAVVKRERLRAAHRQFEALTVWSADPSVARLSEQDGIDVVPLPGYWADTQ
ncbi:phosphatase domain-containing protein [Streptomyces sp. NPDC004822]